MCIRDRDTAVRMNINNRTDAEQSIKAGSEYLHWLLAQIPDSIPEEDRIWYSLAAYTVSYTHLDVYKRQILRSGLGGILMGIGATLAGGCSIGNGLVETAFFSWQGWVSLPLMILGTCLLYTSTSSGLFSSKFCKICELARRMRSLVISAMVE